MLHLAKFAAIAVTIWFYMSAKEKGQPPVNWAVVGLIGYCVAWFAVKLAIVSPFLGMFAKNPTGTFLLYQVPALCGIGAAFLIRKKLLADAEAGKD